MKVVHVLLGRPAPESMNGVSKVVHHLALNQAALGCEVEVWALTHSSRLDQNPEYQTRYFKPSSLRFKLPTALPRIDRQRRGGDTIFHLHSVFLPELFSISRHLRSADVPWVLSPHGGYASLRFQPSIFKSVYARTFERQVTDHAAAIHVLGKFGESEYLSGVARTRIVHVVNGQTRSTTSKTAFSEGKRLKLAFCGRLSTPQKGLDLLIEAVGSIRMSGHDVTLELIGDGPDRPKLENRVRALGLAGSVTFHGAQFGERKVELVLSADAFVHASRWEGLPTAVLEAASMGMPLIVSEATNLGAFTVEAGAGFVISDLSVRGVAEVLRVAAFAKSAGMLAAMGAAARAGAEQTFDWGRVARAHVRNYESILL